MNTPLWVVIVAAAVGSLAGAVVTAIMTMIAQAFERRSRQRELFLAKAVEIAHERSKQIRELAEKSGRPEVLHPSVVLVSGAFIALESIFRTGKLPSEWQKHIDQQSLELEEIAAYLRSK